MVVGVVRFKDNLAFDTSKPDGSFRKVMDVSHINALGWKHAMLLKAEIALSYKDMLTRLRALFDEVFFLPTQRHETTVRKFPSCTAELFSS